jgi:predicted NBD/HSP70 family sugar kinase
MPSCAMLKGLSVIGRAIVHSAASWRTGGNKFAKIGKDPIGDVASADISKKALDKLITAGEPEAAGLLIGTVEEFAQEFATVIRRFLRLTEWRDTQRIVVGGGLRASRVGELAIDRTSVLLKSAGSDVELMPIRHHPDEAGLLGCLHLVPSWIFSGHDGILAVDIGGSNIRVGIVALSSRKTPDRTVRITE